MSDNLQAVLAQKASEKTTPTGVPSYPYFVYQSQEELDRLEEVVGVLRQSKIGRELIDDAVAHKTTIHFDDGMRAYGSYDEVKNDLKLNAKSDANRLVGTMAHEMRHAQQFGKGIVMDALFDTPKTYIQNQAVIEADASATATAVCFELALQGNDKPLESLREKDAHIVNPYQNEAVKGGLNDGSAYKAAFKGWFTDYCTRDSYDILYIKMAQQRKRECKREEEDLKFQRVVPVEDIAGKVCTCNGKPYISEQETKEFFNTPDASTVSFERFNNIYANCYMVYHMDYNNMEGEMKEKLGLTSRPHFSYMPQKVVPEVAPLPTVANRQAEAAGKIAEAKAQKAQDKAASPVMNALLQKKMYRGK